MKHGLGFLMAKSKTLLDDPKIGSKIVKENTTSFSKLFGDTIAKGMARVPPPSLKLHELLFSNIRYRVFFVHNSSNHFKSNPTPHVPIRRRINAALETNSTPNNTRACFQKNF
jgi:hypothetical protein